MNHSIIGAAYVSLLIAVSGTVQAVAISGQGTWGTTLQGRDLDGNLTTFEAYYDTALDVTWLAYPDYVGDWYATNVWISNLDPYGSGITGWRLPSYGQGTDGEMAFMAYITLGNSYSTSHTPAYLINTGPFLSP